MNIHEYIYIKHMYRYIRTYMHICICIELRQNMKQEIKQILSH